MAITCGVDEAGKGCVIGPLVMVALAIDEEGERRLRWMGVKDSKLLSKTVREELFERIKEVIVDFRVEVIEPDAIDHALKDPDLNLNWLEAETSARIVSELNPDKIILDCPSTNINSYKSYVYERLSKAVKDKAELIVEHKADLNYISVAAASIIAKVIRDRQIEHIKLEVGIDFGSGYMSDEKTQQFLKKYFLKHPQYFRKSWESYKRLVREADQRRLFDY